jgi:hypothetical protein
MEIAKSLIREHDTPLLVDKIAVVDLFDENPVLGLRFDQLCCSFFYLQFEVLRIVAQMLFMQGLKIVAEPRNRIKEGVIHSLESLSKFLLVQFVRQDRKQYRSVKLISILNFREGKPPVEAQVRYPLNVFVDPREIIVDEQRAVCIVRA